LKVRIIWKYEEKEGTFGYLFIIKGNVQIFWSKRDKNYESRSEILMNLYLYHGFKFNESKKPFKNLKKPKKCSKNFHGLKAFMHEPNFFQDAALIT
jgi:hypothetical protein